MTPVPVGISNSIAQDAVEEVQKLVKPVAATPDELNTSIANGTSTTTKSGYIHPLDPLTPKEISEISVAIRRYIVEHTTVKAIKFITCSTADPPKRDVLAFLGIPLVTGEQPQTLQHPIIRKADIDFIDLVTGDAYDAVLAFIDGSWVTETLTKLPEGTQPQISVDELLAAETTVRNDPRVQKLAADQGLKPENIYADGWSIGWDSRFPTRKRLQQALMFARFHEHDNLYAYPLDFIPVLDSNSLEVIHIDFPPNRIAKDKELTTDSTAPPSLEEDSLKASGRDRISYPNVPHEYLPEYREKQPGYKPSTREPLKPLHIVQPGGVSFKTNGNEIEWQNWKMHIAFNHREGIALSTITYDDGGKLRPMIYRLSLVEMVVPYAAPEHPHPRKFAFDVGEYGIGTQANDLSLGCDCLGKIHYLPGSFIGQDGTPFHIKRAICIHEEDNGLLWKHTDFRTGYAMSVRSRRLVISMICTVANYEYCFYYYFYQDGTIEFEVKLTGILNVFPLAVGETSTPFSTVVAPRISAQYHQHLFSVRIDPMFDGLQNSVVESDIIPLPAPKGSKENWAGNAFTTTSHTLRFAKEGGREYDFSKDRRWTVVNPNTKKHYASGKSPGYVLGYRGFSTTLLSQPDSWAATRAGFATKSLWIVKDADATRTRMWPSGRYVPQTRSVPEDSVERWAQGEDNIENEDVVLFATLGINHITRPEDWPVMPVERVQFTMRPVNFFEQNPSIDVPGTKDIASVTAFDEAPSNTDGHETNGTNGTVNGSVSCCN